MVKVKKKLLALLATLGVVIGSSVLPAGATDVLEDTNNIAYNYCYAYVGYSNNYGASFISDGMNNGQNQECWAVAVRTLFMWGCGGTLCFGWDQAVVGYENIYGYVPSWVNAGGKYATSVIPDDAVYLGARYWMATTPSNGFCWADLFNGPITQLGYVGNPTTCFTM